ncbi:hypothetical protein QBC46DRAFT_259209 [Diplogelasinospora grovesii]|uniref:Uncharacterized protein n=1 Tax=Diplogelasinospora grovesii TaxID=303347 RepID=A0AAN6S4U8_9PEZI|nr:hypothetical protein QBC46DRAFT_259209 [Diplogelasinospora grovesii]
MSTSGLPPGALITSINGKRCTAIPRSGSGSAVQATATTTAQITNLANTALADTIQTSQTDSSITASTADVLSANSQQGAPAAQATAQGTALPDVTASPDVTIGSTLVTDSPAAATPPFTTIGTAQASTGNAAAEATDSGSSTNSAVSAVPSPNSNAVQSTVAVAGGVIGGVVAISVVAFFVWWWRRRVLKKRRSTLLTPLDLDPRLGRRDEKGEYVINRGSIGPTPMSEKLKAAVGYNMKKVRGRLSRIVTRSNAGSQSNVNLDRGNSQFMEPAVSDSTHSRANSSALLSGGGAKVTSTKDRFVDWWTRLTADMKFNWRLREKDNNFDNVPTQTRNITNEKMGAAMSSGQPDFLTLLSMDDRELDQEAQRRRASISRRNGGSAGSAEHFLGGLSLNLGENPFSDVNALPHTSAKPPPLVVSQPNNPFSDANAIRDPPPPAMPRGNYVADIRRSRGQSDSNTRGRQPSTIYARDSVASVESFGTRRNKFRSDPFDLERPELLGNNKNSITSSTAGTAGSSGSGSRVSRPAGAHMRSESFTSKYSSGISLGDWSDPGPDVGPAAGAAAAAARWPEPRESPTQGWRDRLERGAAANANANGQQQQGSGGGGGGIGVRRSHSGASQASQTSVGKAI